jgi:hypothetical protein
MDVNGRERTMKVFARITMADPYLVLDMFIFLSPARYQLRIGLLVAAARRSCRCLSTRPTVVLSADTTCRCFLSLMWIWHVCAWHYMHDQALIATELWIFLMQTVTLTMYICMMHRCQCVIVRMQAQCNHSHHTRLQYKVMLLHSTVKSSTCNFKIVLVPLSHA